MHLGLIIATRPNIPKIAAIYHAIQSKEDITSFLVHTGQHYDQSLMSDICQDVGLPPPDYSLNIHGPERSENERNILQELKKVFVEESPDLVIVVGDVDATFLSAKAVKKMGIPLAHIEAGLRSFDLSMPEEKNRIETDHISDFLFVTEKAGVVNLTNEGISKEKIYLVGNVMIDTLLESTSKIEYLDIPPLPYLLFTMHRPSNVDSKEGLKNMIELLSRLVDENTVCFPVHPRTESSLKEYGLWNELLTLKMKGLLISPPLTYLKFIAHLKEAEVVITDSGGIQEEALVLETTCVTLRRNTERPSTIEHGGNRLADLEKPEEVMRTIKDVLNKRHVFNAPELWDGRSAERIVNILVNELNGNVLGSKEIKNIPSVI